MAQVGVVAPDPYGNFDARQWEEWLAKETWCGGDHPEKVAVLLQHIFQGIQFVQDKVAALGFATFQRPPLAIVKEPPPELDVNRLGSYLSQSNCIIASSDRLKELSRLPFDRILRIESLRRDSIPMRATAPNSAILFGTEECAHSLHGQKHGIEPLPGNIDILSGPEYDSLDHEFEGLGFQVMAAQEKGMSEVTRTGLVQRWTIANVLRQRRV